MWQLTNSILTWLITSIICFSVLTFSFGGEVFIYANKLNYVLLVAGVAAFIVPLTFNITQFKNYVVKIQFIDFAIAIWLGYIICHSLYNNRYLLDHKHLTLFLVCSFYLLARVNRSFENLNCNFKIIVRSIILLTIVESGIALLQFLKYIPSLNPLFSITGTFKNPAPMAMCLAAIFPCVIYGTFSNWIKYWKIVSLMGILSSGLVICLSGNRASVIASLIVSLLFMLYFYKTKIKGVVTGIKYKRITLISSLIIVILITLSSTVKLYQLNLKSSETRLFVWELTMEKIGDRPLFGIGYGAFKENFNKWQTEKILDDISILKKSYYSKNTLNDFAGYIRMAYNEYIEMASEIGIVGLGIFLIIIFTPLFKSCSLLTAKLSMELFVPFAGLIVLLIEGLFSYPFYSLPTFLLLFFYLSWLTNENTFTKRFIYVNKLNLNIISLFFGLWGLSFIAFATIKIHAFNSYDTANKSGLENDNLKAQISYRNAYSALKNEPLFLIDYSNCLIKNGNNDLAFKYLKQAESTDNDPRIFVLLGNISLQRYRFKDAERYYQIATSIIPSQIYPQYLLVRLYLMSNQLPKALALAKSIVMHKPKIRNDITDQIHQDLLKIIEDIE
jgi:O-antigen polymerase